MSRDPQTFRQGEDRGSLMSRGPRAPLTEEPNFLTDAQIAKRLNVCDKTFRRAMKDSPGKTLCSEENGTGHQLTPS